MAVTARRLSPSALILLAVLLLTTILLVPTVSSAASVALEETISRRKSIRYFTNDDVTTATMLQLLNSAYGYASGSTRTTIEVNGSRSIIVYTVNATASYRYHPENNSLGLYRSDVNKNQETFQQHSQWWPGQRAQEVLVVVWNETATSNPDYGALEAGLVIQNVYLTANSLNLGTTCVGGITRDMLQTAMHLPPELLPLVVMPISYPDSGYEYQPAEPNYAKMTGNLPPVNYGESTLVDALSAIRAYRIWSPQALSTAHLSQILWAAYGYTNITHGGSFHRTTPSSQGIYTLGFSVSNASGVYAFDPGSHSLSSQTSGDQRSAIAQACSAPWAASAPTLLVISYDVTLWSHANYTSIPIGVGLAVQNVFLEASPWGLGAALIETPMAEWDGAVAASLRSILGLATSDVPLSVVPLGYPVDVQVDALVVRTPSAPSQVASTDPWTEHYANASLILTQGTFADLLNVTWLFHADGAAVDDPDDVRDHYTFRWTPTGGFEEPTLTDHLLVEDCDNASLDASAGWLRLALRFGKSAWQSDWTCTVRAFLGESSASSATAPWEMNTYISFTLSSDAISWGTIYPPSANVSATLMPLTITVSTNVDVKIRLRGGGDLTADGDAIPLANVYVGQTALAENNDGLFLSTGYQDWATGIPPTEQSAHPSYWFLSVPAGKLTGVYTFTFYVEVALDG